MTDLRDPIAAEPVSKSCRPSSGLSQLARRLGVAARESEIRYCFDIVCGDSLAPGAGWSSLNADGVPVQFALTFAPGRMPAFEFVGEAFRAGMGFPERRGFGLERMTRLSESIGVEAELAGVLRHLEEFTVAGPAGDGEDPAGAFWIGGSFEAAGSTSMTVYANARRGLEVSRWTRLAAFAERVVEGGWARIFAVAESAGLRPLGAGVRITAGSRPHVRVYFSGYGVAPQDYRRTFQNAGAPARFDQVLATFFDRVLGVGSELPTQSAVFSFGANGDGEWSPKLELCAHCLWSDPQEHCGAWRIAGVPVYIGVGMRRDQPYESVYFNPGRDGL